MITRKKMRWEIARLKANEAYLSLEKDFLEADNSALLSEVKVLREKTRGLEAENTALLDTVAMLCNKDAELTKQVKEQRLKIMSLEAMWGAIQRRNDNEKSA